MNPVWCLHCERVAVPVGVRMLRCGYKGCEGAGFGVDLYPWISDGVHGVAGFGIMGMDEEEIDRMLVRSPYPADPPRGLVCSLYPPKQGKRS
jgi:hypothetical protein